MIDGGQVDIAIAELILGYRLGQTHTAVMSWTTEAAPRLSELEHAADEAARHLHAVNAIRVIASAGII